jgi:MoaA/NifB/PqqE/SkfB family radical SAM enzyme
MKNVTTDEVKACDYSRHGDINEYIGSLKGDKYEIYRENWLQASRCEREFNFPLFLVFETMFQCNFKCVMCIHSAQEKIKYGYKERLPFNKYKEIMDECLQYYCPSLTIGGTSEPLLDVNLADMIGYANESGFVDTMINTNATLLTEERGKELIKNGLTRIRIGFDGATAKTLAKSIKITPPGNSVFR